MARCLHPLTIKSPDKDPFTRAQILAHASVYARDNIIKRHYREIVVPCGKCLACLKNKQSSMVVRCKREAEFRGSFAFMTLTYDDDHLPLAQSLWRVDRVTGEMEVFYKPEMLSTGINPDPAYCDLFKTIEAGTLPRYHEFELNFFDPDYAYMVRITPTVCRSDVRTWIKMARIQYERDHGEKLPDFSYVAISEYGPRTCRPHYHLAFFGLQRKHLNYLLERWTYGKVKQVRIVSEINKDGSNGFLRASKYIGKYMSKGKFECDSVKDCCAERPRVCQSKNLGTKELEPIRRQLLCFDIAGEYDPETLLRFDGQPLSRSVVDVLVGEIPRRLVYRVDERTTLPIPRIIRDKIFKCVKDYDDPKKMVSSSIWCMVTCALRDKLARESDERFAAFCAEHLERDLAENCSEFAYWESYCADSQEASMHEDLQSFYSKSNF